MGNFILVCHGALREHAAFDLAAGQALSYRGNFGAPLGVRAAWTIVSMLRDDPLVTDKHIRRAIPNYQGSYEIEGPGTFGPDARLEGDRTIPCFILNMATGAWLPLSSRWTSTSSHVLSTLGKDSWLNLLCCTDKPDSGQEKPAVDPLLEVNDWRYVLD